MFEIVMEDSTTAFFKDVLGDDLPLWHSSVAWHWACGHEIIGGVWGIVGGYDERVQFLDPELPDFEVQHVLVSTRRVGVCKQVPEGCTIFGVEMPQLLLTRSRCEERAPAEA